MNSELYDNEYQIPKQILDNIRMKLYSSSDAEGIKRAKNLLKSGKCTYQNLKRLKNFFDNFNPSIQPMEEFELAGGRTMRNFVDATLRKERDRTAMSARNKKMAGIDVDLDDPDTRAQDGTVDLTEGELNDEPVKYRNAIAVIFNPDNEILIGKRNPSMEQWMPDKWALFGGSIEAEESADDAIKREIKEETNLDIDKLIKKAVIRRGDAEDHIYLTLYNYDKHGDIVINDEHTDSMFCSFKNLKHYDCVPNLEEYIKLAVEKYE